uniref:C2 domain-containing protein n=1 Tax=Hyaloperonospora arabidopsidis (strain Emoy2) TaxID=559515 RepID=M4BZV2_HYAAE
MADVVTPRVRLVVIGATGVGAAQAATDSTSTTFDPYCQAQCGDVVLRTAAKVKTTSPQWMQPFTFGVKKPLGAAVNLKIFGLSERGRDVLLGSAVLEIETLTPETEMTHKLTLVDATGASCGELVVEATYEPKYMTPRQTETTAAASTDTDKKLSAPVSPKTSVGLIKPAATEEEETEAGRSDALSTSATDALPNADRVVAQRPTRPPNCYVVTILEATGLLACDGTGAEATSDPYVLVACTKNVSQQTRTQQQTLHPSWRQRFYFSITPEKKQLLELTVKDSDLLTSSFMGRCVVDLDEFTKRSLGAKQTFWSALEQQSDAKSTDAGSSLSLERKLNCGRGKICLAIEAKHLDQEISSFEQGEIDNVSEVPDDSELCGLGSPSNGALDNDEDSSASHVQGTDDKTESGDDDDEIKAKQAEVESKRKQQEEERQKMLAELSKVQFQSGDYQIRVRIIEVRDLQPMDANGLCDPVISVECLGQRQHTMVKQKQLSCVFDEYLYFDFRNLDKETIEQGSIQISVFDADGPGSSANRPAVARAFDDLVGFFSVDIPYVYFQPDHELKRKWVALVGSGTTNSDSIQGYVL